jgi:hypothetical protein
MLLEMVQEAGLGSPSGQKSKIGSCFLDFVRNFFKYKALHNTVKKKTGFSTPKKEKNIFLGIILKKILTASSC